ncbi:hypothetical protein SCP_0301690 [Sparassis crispa]|uniref:Uncharacterized protein n=1 Tax=Sparassis crispa TaxID=139825 RepID=A0A401GE43_9APHY|nr:hypothetical protein SCP_0301690 [Sparassis crispa]GBE80454.1 hypothetical protein SCP_0301690 [Sparassis crispa]
MPRQIVTAQEAMYLKSAIDELGEQVSALMADLNGRGPVPQWKAAYWQVHEQLRVVGHNVYGFVPTASGAQEMRTSFERLTEWMTRMGSSAQC